MKKKLNSIQEAIEAIIESSQKHADASQTGDYKTANKNYDLVDKAVLYLRENNGIEYLKELLNFDNISVKVVAASYLLKNADKNALTILEEIASKSYPHNSYTASMVLQEWKNGRLNL